MRIIVMCLILALCGCAGKKTTKKVSDPVSKVAKSTKVDEKKKAKKEAKKEDKDKKRAVAPKVEKKRELGSLWSEGSRWNRLYSVKTFRAVGDVILVRPTEVLRTQISKKLLEMYDQEQNLATQFEDRIIAATIREIVSDGNYKIYSNQSIRFANQYRTVVIEGKIREQEISPDDTVLSDFVFDLKLDLPTDTKKAKADKEETKKAGKKGKRKRAKKRKKVKKGKKVAKNDAEK